MRKAKNCQNCRYSQNLHFEFFFRNFFGNLIFIAHLEIYFLAIFLYDNFQIFPITLVNITNIWSHRLILFCYCSALYSSNVSKSMLLHGKIIRLNYLILLPLKISWSAKLVPYIVTKSFSATKRQVWDQFIALNLAKSYCIKKNDHKI